MSVRLECLGEGLGRRASGADARLPTQATDDTLQQNKQNVLAFYDLMFASRAAPSGERG
jgi:hypothetical protein